MRHEGIAVTLRPRQRWEGLDLGFALARQWFPTLWILWWFSALPIALLGFLLIGDHPDRWLILVWWFKPLYEAPLLIWISRALFGERLSARAFPRMLRAALTWRLLPYLTWRRLGLRRSFLMPLSLLEGLRGRPARLRQAVLSAGPGVAGWHTLVCAHFEAILWGGLLLLIFFLVPEGLPRLDLAATVLEADSWAYWLSVLADLIACSVIAPFYVCAGFTLYLTRRTELEAWDLELAFRQARDDRPLSRLSADSSVLIPRRGVAGLLVAVPGILLLTILPVTAWAQTPWEDPDQAKTLIQQVLADPDFGRTREVRLWMPIPDPADDAVAAELPSWWVGLERILVLLARVLKWGLLVLALSALILVMARVLRDWRPTLMRRLRPTGASGGAQPLITNDADLPDAVPAAVRARLAAGDQRGALSLLYRASLVHLQGQGLDIPDGATETECLALATRTLPPTALGPLTPLTQSWLSLAYAHCLPSDVQIEALLADWCRWTRSAAALTHRASRHPGA